MRWSEQRRRVSAYEGDAASTPPAARSLRLSSRLTWLWRGFNHGVVLVLVAMLVRVDLQNHGLNWTGDRLLAYVALVPMGLLMMWLTDFVDVRLEGDDVVVSQFFRTRRFPAVLISAVSERTFPSGVLGAITVVFVELGERVPGIGRRFRFVPGSSTVPDAAGVLLDASVQPYPRAAALVLVCAFALSACGVATGERIGTHTHGDTTHHVHASPGPWGVIRDPKPELVVTSESIGLALGRIEDVLALADDGVALYDASNERGRTVLQLDSLGRLVRTIGRAGQGPGEFGSPYVRLAAAPDGVLFAIEGARLHRFREGVPLPLIPLGEELIGRGGPLIIANADHSVTLNGPFIGFWDRNAPYFVKVDTTGSIVDSIVARASWMGASDSLWTTRGEWAVALRDGGWIKVRRDRIGFMRLRADGTLAFISEMNAEPPFYRMEERAELQRVEQWTASSQRESPARTVREVPRRKPLLRWAFEDNSGRIWLQRSAEAFRIPPEVKYFDFRGKVEVSWGEPVSLVAFDSTGALLGEIVFPLRSKVAIGAQYAWVVTPGDLDVPVIARYRLPVMVPH
jgi:hypothetical protein